MSDIHSRDMAFDAMRNVIDTILRMDFEDGIPKDEWNALMELATDAANLADEMVNK